MPDAVSSIRYRSAIGRGVLLASVLGSAVALIDGTVVNVALPALARDLDASLAGLQWTIDGYLLALGSLLLVGGAAGDRFGRKRTFIIGLCWFAIASALCGCAPSVQVLVAARVIQGIGAALLVPGSLAILRSSLHPDDQAQAIGAWAGLSGVATAVGPLLGGWLIQTVSWRLVFWINLPVAAVAVWFALRCLPSSSGVEHARLDWAGAATAAIGLGGMTFALIEGPSLNWRHPVLWAAILIGTGSLIAFFFVESRQARPMLPLRLFRSRQFAGANATTLAVYFALSGGMFLLMLQLQRVLGYSPFTAGASFAPVTVLLLVLSPVAARLAERVGYRAPMTLGPLIAGVGMIWLSAIEPGATYLAHILPGVLVLGLGLSLTVAPLTTAVLDAVDSQYAGIASAVNNAAARIAGLLGVALVPLAGGISPADLGDAAAFTQGFRRGMWTAGIVCFLGALSSLLMLGGRGKSAEPAAESNALVTEGNRGSAPRP